MDRIEDYEVPSKMRALVLSECGEENLKMKKMLEFGEHESHLVTR